MRTRHAHRPQAQGDSRPGRHAPEPWRGEFRRPHPRDQRPRASQQGNRPRLCLRARDRLPPGQHRPHRRHGRGNRGELAGERPKTIELSPDSVTIYEMVIPYNTTIYQRMKAEGKLAAPVADWDTKRARVND